MDYKSTLNLPQTGFPMKANLKQKEKEFLLTWENALIYEKIKKKTSTYIKFILHDGPPYANGHIHMGHALNKILKDIIIKYKTMSGFMSNYIPGWDCHGLPIEHHVDKTLDHKENMDINQIRQKCREYAEKFIDIQREEFKQLGIFGEWENPYLTMSHKYEATIIREFSKFVRSSSVYKGFKPVHWCPSCRTALAEAEVEYMDHSSPSVYVGFKIDDPLNSKRILQLKDVKGEAWFIIWTTTPWTLPANLAIAVHPDMEYSIVSTNEDYYIIASELLSNVMHTIGISGYKIINTITGKELEGIKCSHPFIERVSKVILGSFVTLDQGSGCVHIAPGHGQEDYEIGLKYGLEIYAPVDDTGRFTEDVEGLSGQRVFDANNLIIERMSANGTLLHKEKIIHSYPHCWRCKSPVIFRATEQWFISLDHKELRKRTLDEIHKVQWIPSWGENRISGMIENRPDWCISRQRSWGVPLVILYCNSCNKPIMDPDLIDYIAGKVEEEGVDIWFSKAVEEIIPYGTKCPNCTNMSFRKEKDILDVWFESGVSYSALIEDRTDMDWPADLYLEGSDQHRGWFHSSILIGVETHKSAPYRAVLTHGFVVDGEGKKMSKSAGNVIAPQKVIGQYGAEILRLWVAAEDYREDIRISNDILTRLAEAYRRIRNTCRFILGNLYDFDLEKDIIPFAEREELDKWILHRFQYIKEKIIKGYNSYQFHICFHTLHQFCVVDLSAFYLDISKDYLYASRPGDTIRKSTQSTMYEILYDMVRIMAPILVFTADEVWGHLPRGSKDDESVHLAEFPEIKYEYIDEDLAKRWEKLIALKEDISKSIEEVRVRKDIGHSLDAEVELFIGDEELFNFISSYLETLKSILIVSSIKINKVKVSLIQDAYKSKEFPNLGVIIRKAPGKKCGRCWQYSLSVGKFKDNPNICERCKKVISFFSQ